MVLGRLILALVLLLAAAAPHAAAPDVRVLRVESWLKAVLHHQTGSDDAALLKVASWSNSDLQTLWMDVKILVQLMRNLRLARFSVRAEGQRNPTPVIYTAEQLHRLRVLACAAGGLAADRDCVAVGAPLELDDELKHLSSLAFASKQRGDDNYVLRRGALLHGDIAMAGPETLEPVNSGSPVGPVRIRMNINDGQQINLGRGAVHWDLATMLLDGVKPPDAPNPAPGRDEMVRRWYRATSAWMQDREHYDAEHLDRARGIFPDDPVLLFLSGCIHETYAAPTVQSAVRSAVLPTGVTLAIRSDRAELREAEGLFRRALESQPDFPEAHLRLGRVLGLLGKYEESAQELRRTLASLDDDLLVYYGALFLGASEEALGNFDAARGSYERAAALYPTAQSPLVALSQLARRRGDRAAALRGIQQVFELGSSELDRDDPWWTYHVAQARDADDLLEELRRPFRRQPGQ